MRSWPGCAATSERRRRARRAEIAARHLRPRSDRPASSARGVHHVALLSNDVERTVRFYQDVLEFPLTEMFENRDYGGSTHFFFDIGNGNALAFFDLPGLGLGAVRRGARRPAPPRHLGRARHVGAPEGQARRAGVPYVVIDSVVDVLQRSRRRPPRADQRPPRRDVRQACRLGGRARRAHDRPDPCRRPAHRPRQPRHLAGPRGDLRHRRLPVPLPVPALQGRGPGCGTGSRRCRRSASRCRHVAWVGGDDAQVVGIDRVGHAPLTRLACRTSRRAGR